MFGLKNSEGKSCSCWKFS